MVFPYIKNKTSVTKWWGNEQETLDFAIENIRDICEKYNGNPSEVFICGFSRGAIGVNYLGLHNDEIADVWLGFFTHDHYDGVRHWKGSYWGSPFDKYQKNAINRFKRIKNRNVLISQNVAEGKSTHETKEYIEKYKLDTLANITYNLFSTHSIIKDIPSEEIPHEHTDKWLLYDSKYQKSVIKWFKKTIKKKPKTFTISGKITDSNRNPLEGILIETGKTHFSITDKKGNYRIDGLVKSNRKISVLTKDKSTILSSKNIQLNSDYKNLNFQINLSN